MKEYTLINTEVIPHVASKAISHILGLEGGYVNDPNDRGGATNFGISDLADGVPDGLIDINGDGLGDIPPEQLTVEQAIAIYYRGYWLANSCHIFPEYYALMVFDTAVNQGGSFARKTLQHTLGVKADGVIGNITLRALDSALELTLLTDYTQLRLLRYGNLVHKKPAQAKFLNGWINRSFKVLTACQNSLFFGVKHD